MVELRPAAQVPMNGRLVVELLAIVALLIVAALVGWRARARGSERPPRLPPEADEPTVLAVDLSDREPPP